LDATISSRMDIIITCLDQSNRSAVGRFHKRDATIPARAHSLSITLPIPTRRTEGAAWPNDRAMGASWDDAGSRMGGARCTGIAAIRPRFSRRNGFAYCVGRVIAIWIVDKLAHPSSAAI